MSRPIVPAPTTSTDSPTRGGATAMACTAQDSGSTTAASGKDRCSGMWWQLVAGTATYSAAAPLTVSPVAPQLSQRFPRHAAPAAVTAEQGGVDGHPVPFGDEVHPATDRDDLTGELVAGHDGERRGREQPGGDVQVGSADSHRADPDDDLAGSGRRVGDLAHMDLVGLVDHSSAHLVLLVGGAGEGGGFQVAPMAERLIARQQLDR